MSVLNKIRIKLADAIALVPFSWIPKLVKKILPKEINDHIDGISKNINDTNAFIAKLIESDPKIAIWFTADKYELFPGGFFQVSDGLNMLADTCSVSKTLEFFTKCVFNDDSFVVLLVFFSNIEYTIKSFGYGGNQPDQLDFTGLVGDSYIALVQLLSKNLAHSFHTTDPAYPIPMDQLVKEISEIFG